MSATVRAVGHTTFFSELPRLRALLPVLTWRDLRVRYKQSLLGIGWAVLLPVSMMLLFTFVFTRAIGGASAFGVRMPYPLYAFAGLVPWTFFSTSLGNCVNSLVANRNLVTKVYFPREVFPLSCVASALVDFAIALLVLIALIVYFHFRGDWTFAPTPALLFVPVVLLIQIALTVGLGMILAMGNLFYRDVRQVFSIAIQLWMFVSAVVVPLPHDGSFWAKLFALNPLVPIISAYRDCILNGRGPDVGAFLYAAVVAILFLIFGWIGFRRASFRFAECI